MTGSYRRVLASVVLAVTVLSLFPSFAVGQQPEFRSRTLNDPLYGTVTEYWLPKLSQIRFWSVSYNMNGNVSGTAVKLGDFTAGEILRNDGIIEGFLAPEVRVALEGVLQVPSKIMSSSGRVTSQPLKIVLAHDSAGGYGGVYNSTMNTVYLNLKFFLDANEVFDYAKSFTTVAHEATHMLLRHRLRCNPGAQGWTESYRLLQESLAFFVQKMAYPRYVSMKAPSSPGLVPDPVTPPMLADNLDDFWSPDIRWSWNEAIPRYRDPDLTQPELDRVKDELASIGYYLVRGWHDWGYPLLRDHLPNAASNRAFIRFRSVASDPVEPFRNFLNLYSAWYGGAPRMPFEKAIEKAYGRPLAWIESSYWSWIGSGVERGSMNYSPAWYESWKAGGRQKGVLWTWEAELWSRHWDNLNRVNQQMIDYFSQLVGTRGVWQGVLDGRYSRGEISEGSYNYKRDRLASIWSEFTVRGQDWWFQGFVPDLNGKTNFAMILGRATGATTPLLSDYDIYLNQRYQSPTVQKLLGGWVTVYEQRLRYTVY